jgi:RNA polymerase sigma-70 factor (ECF subfamily)
MDLGSDATRPPDSHRQEHSSGEAVVIARAKEGDAESIAWLYERYAPLVRRYIVGRVGDPLLAEDICSDVFVKVIESLGRYEDRGWPFSAWLYRIAYARTMDILRQSRRRPSIPLDEQVAGRGDSFDETILARVAYHELQQLMGVLTSEQRTVLRLRFDEDRSLAEVAQSLGRTVGSVKALQHRGLARLAEELSGRFGAALALG